MFNSLHEECGIFGIYTKERSSVAVSAYFALYALQHRGQESCGIVVNDRGVFNYKKELGLVNEVFDKETLLKLGSGKMAVGHVRYAASEHATPQNSQPMVVRHIKGPMTIAHNGSLVNSLKLREEYELNGGIFHSTSDSEVISYAITEQRLISGSIEQAVEKAMYRLKGAYSLILMSPKKLIAVRDPHGFRPLCLGELPNNEGYVVASESCALDSISAKFLRDIDPGEIVIINSEGVRSVRTHCESKSNICVFEYVYFARPDSVIEGASVQQSRVNAGRFLAKEHPVNADIVIGVPDSGLDAAMGFSLESGIPYGTGFVKNRYVGRTFIQPAQGMREDSVKIKLNPVSEAIKGKRVVMIDDSIVRGTTCGRIVKLLRETGALEVHVRISSPPFKNPCYFGTDIDSRENLIACQMSIEGIKDKIGADSLGYLSVEGVSKMAENARCGFCVGCFTGEYPVDVPDEKPKDKFILKLSQ
ncbi:MAG: amidophosphoribosyltransferase [Eubacterium sp.]|jgi:amidophosphoribosyltransferase|nr:amidophosphoribosyltransferase [Eubacterium sp.]